MTGPVGQRGGRLLPIAGRRRTWRELRVVARPHRWTLAAAVVIGLLGAGLGLVVPAALGWLVDRIAAAQADLGTIILTAVIMIVATSAGAIGSAVTVVLAARSYHAMVAELRERLVARAMRLPQGEVEQAGTGDLISRTNDDVTAVTDAAPQLVPAFTRAGFSIVMTLAGIAVLDWRYAMVLIASLPIWLLCLRCTCGRGRQRTEPNEQP